MAYTHGIKISEVSTSVLPPVSVSAGIPFIVGTAPVNMADPSNVNKPVLVSNYSEAVAAFGYVPAKPDAMSGLSKYEYTISEFIYSQFALYGVGPAIIVNVLDPATHKKTADAKSVTLDARSGSAVIEESGIEPDSVSLAKGETAYTRGTDYVVSFDEDGNLVISSLKGPSDNFLCSVGEALTFGASKLDPSAVDAGAIIGGVSPEGKKSGFELVSDCFPRFRLVPGILLAPGFSDDPRVAAVMSAKAANINETFEAIALIDADTLKVTQYSAVAEWKNSNNVTDPRQICCWPCLSLGGVLFHQSTQLAGVLGLTDSNNDDVPYVSPSNQSYQMTASVLEDGTEVWLGQDNAAYLNGQGVVTALNFIGGWKCWGNRTACYPGNTDVKDAFISIRRTMGWIGNTLVQSFWQRLDAPLNRRQIDTIVDSANLWLNGLAARQYILGGRVEFLDTENPTIDLMDGKARFHVYVTPASPNREIDFILEYDPKYIETLFE